MALIGWLGYRATKNLSDYILGGRRLGAVITALAVGASGMSGWLMMGFPGSVYTNGLSEIWILIGIVGGAWLLWTLVAARLRFYTEKFNNALTIPEYLCQRFEDKHNSLRLVAAITILVFFTLYCASGVVAGARLFQNVFSVSYTSAMWIGAAVTIVYVFFGGYFAISWTDAIQASIMVLALILAPILLLSYSGGLTQSIQQVHLNNPLQTSWFGDKGWIAILSLLGWGLGCFGQPHILLRFMSAKSAQQIPVAKRLGLSWTTTCLIGAMAIGLLGISYFLTFPDRAAQVNANPELVFIEISKQLFNPWMTGFILAAILAAIMSTLSAQLLLCSSALTEDIYRTFFRKKASQSELIWIGRIGVLVIALFSVWLAKNPHVGILKLVGYAWAGFGAAFGPVILLSLLWPRMTQKAAFAGIILGATTVLIWSHYHWLQLYELIPGFFASLAAIFSISLLGTKPSVELLQKITIINQEFKVLSGSKLQVKEQAVKLLESD